MTSTSAVSRPTMPSGAASSTRRKKHPGAVARLRAAVKVVRAQVGSFERSIRVSIITDPEMERRIPTILNTGSEIHFNRRFLVQVADGSRKLLDILEMELGRAVTVALGKRARNTSS